MDAISEQAKFLSRHGIDNDKQLNSFRTNTEQRIAALTAEHKALSNEKRRSSVPEERKTELVTQISALSVQLKSLRRDVRLCNAILERSMFIAEKQEQLNKQKQDDKERNTINRNKPYR